MTPFSPFRSLAADFDSFLLVPSRRFFLGPPHSVAESCSARVRLAFVEAVTVLVELLFFSSRPAIPCVVVTI